MNKWISQLSFSLVILLATTSCSAGNKAIAPFFNDQILLNSLIAKPIHITNVHQLKSLLETDWQFSLVLTKEKSSPLSVNKCEKLLKAETKGYQAEHPSDQRSVDALDQLCRVVSKMLTLQPSKSSYLSHFKLDKKLTTVAPSALAVQISKDDVRRAKKRSTWQQMDTIKQVKKLNASQSIYFDKSGYIQKVTLLAKGDFNHDGIEDAVLYFENSVKGGHYASTKVFVITRFSANSPYTVINTF